MYDFSTVKANLEQRGFAVSCFATAEEATAYLDGKLDGKTIGIGGSVTIREMGLDQRLEKHNQVLWHWKHGTLQDAASTQVYLTSVNGLAETGELINIDGTGNRVAATIYGHKEVYFVVGVNKVEPDYERALWRARNIASPKNAQRLGVQTPCAARGDKCYDCDSPQRICRALTVLWRKPNAIPYAEVVLVGESLGL